MISSKQIRTIVIDLTKTINFSTTTLKSLRKLVAIRLNVEKKSIDKTSLRSIVEDILKNNLSSENTASTIENEEEEEEEEEVVVKSMNRKKKKKTAVRTDRKRPRRPSSTSKRKKKTEKKSKRTIDSAVSKMIRAAGIGPSIYRNLPEDVKKKRIELVNRIRGRGFEILGSVPSASEIQAAQRARDLKLSMDGIDTSNIIQGDSNSGRSRRRTTIRKNYCEENSDSDFEDESNQTNKKSAKSRDDDSEDEFCFDE